MRDADEIDAQIASADEAGVATLQTRLAGLEPIPELAGRVAGLENRLASRSSVLAEKKKEKERQDEQNRQLKAARSKADEIDGQIASADATAVDALLARLDEFKEFPDLDERVGALKSKLESRSKQIAADEKAERDRKAVDDWQREALRRLAELDSVDASADFPTAASKLAKLDQVIAGLPKAPDLPGIEDARKPVQEKVEQWRAKWQQLQATEAPPPEKPFDLKGIFGDSRIAEADATTRRGALALAQKKLKEQGFYDKAVDGDTGRGTHDAIIEFQRRNNLPLTARLDQATWDKIGFSATTPEEMREEGKKWAEPPRRRTRPAEEDTDTALGKWWRGRFVPWLRGR